MASTIQQCESVPSTHMSPPSWASPAIPTASHPSRLSGNTVYINPVLYCSFPLAVYTHGSMCMSVLLSQFVPTSPSPDVLYDYSNLMWFSVQFSSVAPTLCDPMNRSTPGLPVHHQLLGFTQTHVHRVSDAIQPSHPLMSPSPSAPNPSQHQSLFQWVNSSHEVGKVLEFQLQHQSCQWTSRTHLL